MRYKKITTIALATLMGANFISNGLSNYVYAQVDTAINLDNSTKNEESLKNDVKTARDFNLNDWNYTDNGTSILLTGYNGNDTELVVPGEYDGKQVLLDNLQIFSQNMTNLQILEVNGKKVKIDKDSKDMFKLYFKNYSSGRSMDLRGLDVSNLDSMDSMFSGCSKLESLDITGWDVSNIKSFSFMLANTSRLTDLKGIENLDVSSAVNMMSMFASIGVKELDLSNWNTSNVTDMSYMFNQTRNLESINASTWDTSKVKDMNSMFINNDSLKIIDLSNWDTSNVTNMSSMFRVGLGGLKQNLLVVTKDEKLKNYDYSADNRLASGPTFLANGGAFADGTTSKKRNIIYTVESLDDVDTILKEVEEIKDSMEIPTYEERVFVKWVKTPYDKPNDLLEVWDKLNAEYVAEWKVNSYKVTFDSQGGSNVPEVDVEFDSLITEPQEPTREGYTFGGWYKEPDCQNAWDFGTEKMPSNNITLYAKWILNASELNHIPVINAMDKVLTVGDTFNPLDGVTAHDKEDGEIKLSEANIIANDVDMSKAGTYSITYKVTDSKGASSLKTITVVVNPKLEIINHVPVINAMDKVLTVGDTFNPLDGVTAHDKEDGEIKLSEANIIANDVDMSKAGTYSITYKVTDSKGASSLKTITVVVNEKATTPIEKTENKPAEKPNEVPQTGDATNVGLFGMMFADSGGMLLGLFHRKRKKSRK